MSSNPDVIRGVRGHRAAPRYVRAQTPGGRYVGMVEEGEAERLIGEGFARGVGGTKKRKYTALVMLYARSGQMPPAAVRPVYREELPGGRTVWSLKRAVDVFERKGRGLRWVGYSLEAWPDRGRGGVAVTLADLRGSSGRVVLGAREAAER